MCVCDVYFCIRSQQCIKYVVGRHRQQETAIAYYFNSHEIIEMVKLCVNQVAREYADHNMCCAVRY